ncbi:hypothetical protein GJU43_22545 [Flavobacterium sp. LC2016-23]|uniref:GAP1-N1 domain-containing protein n=1 Tax=Flavobacterium sp. LC2016-23 TaxID=2666330 RepID=UPI0012AEE1B6|nr:hypothetical protein [Flavobacterium sp. LC2016-23]MRX42064.1 hypothetical protein [Flavobacterium sp. LC2016-23]
MRIKIEQTLHGYQNGHELLMSSSALSSDAKKVLLVQSDLSGSNIDEGFKIYISGFPLATHYAFSKTWYADEMQRPGCVWTHTLLISFADLGKIPDLDQLLTYFRRPEKNDYFAYSSSIFIEKEDLKNSKEIFDNTIEVIPVLDALYDHPEKTVLCPAYNSVDYERKIVQIWSNQWPRLRRNFSFCSGALNLKILEGVEFDLQIVPQRSVSAIEKQSTGSITISQKVNLENNWIALFNNISKNKLRKFLWLYGSDVKGLRKNYKPLLELLEMTECNKPDVERIINIIYKSFEEKEGFLLKNEMYNSRGLFNINELQVLNYLISDHQHYPEKGFINEKLVTALKENRISVNEFFDFYMNSAPELLDSRLLENVSINSSDLIDLLKRDSRLINIFSGKIPEIATVDETWYLPIETQRILIEILEYSQNVNWEDTIKAILKSNSSIIFSLLKNSDSRIYIVLKFFNNRDFLMSTDIQSYIFGSKVIVKDFIYKNISALSSQFCSKIFEIYNYNELISLELDSKSWQIIYKKLIDENVKIYASCILLSLGFNRKISNPALIVSECFNDVYFYARISKIDYNIWKFIPIDKEMPDEEDSISSILNFLFLPKKKEVPNWDFCELLIRTLVNKFIKFNWPQQYFLDSLKIFETTKSAFSYALGFKKGQKFLKDLLMNIKKNKVKKSSHHIQLIDSLKRHL